MGREGETAMSRQTTRFDERPTLHRATADFVLSSPLMGADYERGVPRRVGAPVE
jgi:hypothetical protein